MTIENPLAGKSPDELKRAYLDSLPSGSGPAVYLCGDYSHMHAIDQELERRQGAAPTEEASLTLAGLRGELGDAQRQAIDRSFQYPDTDFDIT